MTYTKELDTSKDMLEGKPEHSFAPQQPEQRRSISTQLAAYIDMLEAPSQSRLAILNELGDAAPQRLDISEPDELQQEIARFEHMKQEVQQGNYTTIATELQAQRAEPEAALAELRPQLRPRGEMSGDERYYALKDEILAGEAIQRKVAGTLDEHEQAWIAKSIEYRQREQRHETARGRLMSELNNNQQKLNEITHLQQLISTPRL